MLYFAAATYLDCIGYDVSSPSRGYRTNGGDYPDAFFVLRKEVDGLTASKIPQGRYRLLAVLSLSRLCRFVGSQSGLVDGDIEDTGVQF